MREILNYNISSTTPIFIYGANKQSPEMRVPSIRGMIRWWFDALGKSQKADDILGCADGNAPKASKVILRIKGNLEEYSSPKLPHKGSALTPAFKSGGVFTLEVKERFKMPDEDWNLLKRVIETWLMLGGLGGRSTRAAGSVYNCGKEFNSPEEWLGHARELISGSSNIEVYMTIPDEQTNGEALRRVISNTVEDPKFYSLGAIRPKRITSPIKFKIVKIKDKYALAVIYDKRGSAKENLLQKAIDALKSRGKPLARYLEDAIKK